jgi:hypothetical protein
MKLANTAKSFSSVDTLIGLIAHSLLLHIIMLSFNFLESHPGRCSLFSVIEPTVNTSSYEERGLEQ